MARYFINGKDLQSTFGIIVESGSDGFLQMPKPKPYYKYDWGGENGVETDPTEPVVFEPRAVTVRFAIIVTAEASFWANYIAFINEINKPGLQKLFIEEAQRSFMVKNDSPGEFKRLTRLRGNQPAIVAEFSVNFLEPKPSLFGEAPVISEPGNPAPALTQYDWGYSANAVYGTDYEALAFQFTGGRAESAPSLDFTSAANFNYLYVKVPADAKVYANWTNTSFNYGKFPDQVFSAPVEANGFRYYISRVPVLLDRDNTSIKIS